MGPYMSEHAPVELDMKIMNLLNQKVVSPHGSVKLMISVLRPSAYDKNSFTLLESDDETGPEEQEIPHNIYKH